MKDKVCFPNLITGPKVGGQNEKAAIHYEIIIFSEGLNAVNAHIDGAVAKGSKNIQYTLAIIKLTLGPPTCRFRGI